jgi:hypothetical protein
VVNFLFTIRYLFFFTRGSYSLSLSSLSSLSLLSLSLVLLFSLATLTSSRARSLSFFSQADEFGDRFLEPADVASLRRCLDRVGDKRPELLPWQRAVDARRKRQATSDPTRGHSPGSGGPGSFGGLTPPPPKRGAALLFGPPSKTPPRDGLGAGSAASANAGAGAGSGAGFLADGGLGAVPEDGASLLPDWRSVALEGSLGGEDWADTPLTAFWRRDAFTVRGREAERGERERERENEPRENRLEVDKEVRRFALVVEHERA